MSKLSILIAPDKRLNTRANEVTIINNEIKKLVNDMFDTMYHTNGLGLAAVQVGVLKRIFVMDVVHLKSTTHTPTGYKSSGKFCMINPRIIESSDEQVILEEGCLSIPKQSYEIKRLNYLTVKYRDLNNKEHTLKASGWLARCIQHEIDHLNGILYIKHLSKLKYDIAIKKAQKLKKYYEHKQ
ncbi:MAG: peptide deformylase [Wolbachia endosymbiont of Menacanthus eurysternus]|nr:MAG: peptide deformylase [Wolbachia endosymbiont of Menacanthus eurysternus]